MARIKIIHSTDYTYRNPVGLTRHQLMMRPDDSHDLRLHSADLKVEPEPASVRWKIMVAIVGAVIALAAVIALGSVFGSF
jgi:transglutaminase superfamily protein